MSDVLVALLNSNWFVGGVTLFLLVVYTHFNNVGNVDAANQFKDFVVMALGVLFGKVGSGLAVARKINKSNGNGDNNYGE